MRYNIQVHYSGVESYEVEAESLEQARTLAIDAFYDGNEGRYSVSVYKTYGIELEEKTNV